VLLLTGLFALTVGAYDLTIGAIMDMLFPFSVLREETQLARGVLLDIRIPRVLLAACVGAGLSLAGVMLQVLLRNVLADPYILGVSGGASVGALICIATGLSAVSLYAQPIAAFAGALLVVVIVYILGFHGRQAEHTLLLSGVMLGAFLSAIILGIVTTMDQSVRNALFWLVGYLGNATPQEIRIVLPTVVVLSAISIAYGGKMNLLALGKDSAEYLGVSTRSLRAQLFVLASLLTAIVVSFSGAIGFVGLIVPHVCRMITGPDHRILLPAAMLTGSIFMILADIVARSIIAPSELPVGAVTAALGSPVFLYMLLRSRKQY